MAVIAGAAGDGKPRAGFVSNNAIRKTVHDDAGSRQLPSVSTAGADRTRCRPMITSVGSSAVLQLFTGTTATNSKAEDAAQRISEIVSGVTVGASPAVKQVASLAASLAWTEPASTTDGVDGSRASRTRPPMRVMDYTTFEGVNAMKTIFQENVEKQMQQIEAMKANPAAFSHLPKMALVGIDKETQAFIWVEQTVDDIIRRLEESLVGMRWVADRHNFAARGATWEADVRDKYDVAGTIFFKTEDGKLKWGTFEVRDRFTGGFVFGHDGSGVGKEYDAVTDTVREFKLR